MISLIRALSEGDADADGQAEGMATRQANMAKQKQSLSKQLAAESSRLDAAVAAADQVCERCAFSRTSA